MGHSAKSTIVFTCMAKRTDLIFSIFRLPFHLALVVPRVFHLRPGDLEYPGLRSLLVDGGETLVLGVREGADGEDAEVGGADPGHLRGHVQM